MAYTPRSSQNKISNGSGSPVAKDSSAPVGLITSLLVGFPFLCLLLFEAVLRGSKDYLPSLTLAAILMQGLSICFYWRRLTHNALKSFIGWLYIFSQWMFIFGIVFIKVLKSISPHFDPNHAVLMGLFTIIITGILFSIAWGMESKGLARVQTIFCTVLTMLLAVGLYFVPGKGVTQKPIEDLIWSAGNIINNKVSGSLAGGRGLSGDHGKDKILRADVPKDGGGHDGGGASHDDHSQKESSEKGAAHWGYQGPIGPDNWGDLSPEFETCKKGVHQSPIDIDKRSATLKNLRFTYKKSMINLVDNGHTIKADYEKGSTIEYNGNRYQLVQFHFHSPSEHEINGVSYPLEIHFVHSNEKGELTVLGVMGEKGDIPHREIDKLWQGLSKEEGSEKRERKISVNAFNLYPMNKKAYSYMGSLTTPPCTENVTWYVFKDSIKVSQDQIQTFRKLYSGNNRPVQPINGRNFFRGDEYENIKRQVH
ncbi:MAG: carbonic anhydrase family protein [Oligoflexales bacterium]|nr:carbonic anhydrase family protein [Oligoflexales bacterium]